MRIIKYILAGCLILITGTLSNAQTPADDVVFKALNDEMSRSLTDLKLDSYKPPFFLASYLSNGKNFTAKASLGALIRSKESPTRNSSYRLMVGSYELNDENFQNNSRSYNSGGANLSLPKENEYWAIRRAFWSTNDRSYKNSIDEYTQKITALKQQNKDESEKIDDYTRMAPVNLIMKDIIQKYDKAEWEKSIKDLSAIFRNYPKIQSSSVDVYLVNSTVYLVNSEGSKIKYSGAIACLTVNADTQANDGEALSDQLTYYAPLNEQLPSIETMKLEIQKMAQNLETRCSAVTINESYQGPVVFEGEALAELFNYKLFGTNGLLTSREPVYAAGAARVSVNKMENKIGKRICTENISIVSLPKMKNYGNTPLTGSFDIDAEGVVPTDSLVLVDKGILKTQLSDRIPTQKVKKSNGYNRFNIWGGYQKSPGVIEVAYNKGQSSADFLKTVAAETERNGLEYFYIIRRMETANPANQIQVGNSGLPKPIAIYKISVKTGQEQLVRSAVISDFPMLSFKYVLAGTINQVACNILRGNSMPVSYIVPNAIAFNDVSIEKDNTPKSKLPVLENPLVALK